MSIILALPAQKQVLNAYTLFVGKSPSAADFTAHVAFITANGADAYNAFLNGVAKDIPVATLASNMLTNLGLTAIFTQTEAVSYLTSNSSNLGGAMTAVATAVLNYVSDPAQPANDLLVAASAAYVITASNSLTYSTTATNTSAGSLNAATAAVAGDSFTLTTGVDSATSSKIINGLFTDTPNVETWNLTDTVSGTSATDDALNITVVGDANGVTRAGLQTTGIENVNIRYVDGSTAQEAGALTLATGGFTGMTKLSVKDATIANTVAGQADTITLTGIASGVALEISNNSVATNVAATYGTAATSGAADTLTMALAGRNGTVTVGTGFETVALTSSGDTGRVASLTTTTAKTVTLAGTGLKIDGIMDATMTSFDASTSTGPVNVYLATGATLTSAKGGAGTTDVLAVNSLGLIQTLAGFETLVASGTAGTYNLTNAVGVTTLGVGTGLTSAAFTNAAATQNTISISGGAQRTTAAAATGSLTTGTIGYALKTATGIADTLTIAVDNGGTASTGTSTIGAITANAIESITITEADWTGITIGGINTALTATGNYTLTASGASRLALGTVAVTSGLATGTDTYNFADQTGTLSAVLTNATNSVSFTSGTGVATITAAVLAAATNTGTYTLGNAANVVTITSALVNAGGANTLTGGTGNDTFILSGVGSIGAATTTAGTVTTTAGFGTVAINGGTGTADTIKVTQTGTAAVDVITMSNIDQITFQGSNKTTLTANVATGYADTVGVTFVGATTDVMNFAAASGGTLSLANVSKLGTGTIVALGAAGAETITASTTAAHQIDGAGGGDTITLTGSTASIQLIVDAGASSAVATGTVGIIAAGTGINAAEVFSTTGMDIVTGFAVGDTIQLNKADGAVAITTQAAIGILTNGGTFGVATAGDVAEISGTYSVANATFTAGAGGADTAIIYDNDGTIAAGTYTAIILVGYLDAGTRDTVGATGLYTGVA